jgi:hypothetical protein
VRGWPGLSPHHHHHHQGPWSLAKGSGPRTPVLPRGHFPDTCWKGPRAKKGWRAWVPRAGWRLDAQVAQSTLHGLLGLCRALLLRAGRHHQHPSPTESADAVPGGAARRTSCSLGASLPGGLEGYQLPVDLTGRGQGLPKLFEVASGVAWPPPNAISAHGHPSRKNQEEGDSLGVWKATGRGEHWATGTPLSSAALPPDRKQQTLCAAY